MTVVEYYEQQKMHHGRKARNSKILHYGSEALALVFGALLTVLIGLGTTPLWMTLSISGSLVVLTGIPNLFRFQEKWILFRGISEELREAHVEYQFRIGRFSGLASDSIEPAFAERLQEIVRTGTVGWRSLSGKKNAT